MLPKAKPSADLLISCKLLGIKREKGFIFTYKGHEVDLSSSKDRPVHVMACIAEQLAERLTEVYKGNIKALFGEDC